MEICVGDSDPIAAMVDIKEPVIVILAVGHIRRKIAVVDPDVLRLLDSDSVAAVLVDLAEAQVLDDDVLGLLDQEAGADELAGGVLAEDGLVAANADLLPSVS